MRRNKRLNLTFRYISITIHICYCKRGQTNEREALIGFVWNVISGDVIGNAAYDGGKAILGKGFDRLASYDKENNKNDFEIALQAFPRGFRFAV